MNLAETSDLLAFIARCDNRRADDSTVVAWHSIVGDLLLDDCLAAARRHFAESEAYLMPVHIRRGALELDRERRKARREAHEAAERLAIESDPSRRDRSDETRALIAKLRDSLPDGDPDKLRRAEWLDSDKRRDRLNEANANPDYDPTVAIAAASETDHATTRAATLAATKGS